MSIKKITYKDRIQHNGHKGCVLWFTGFSGAGKTTLSQRLQAKLFSLGKQVYVLDGDVVRQGLNQDLGFSEEDRMENIRRVAECAKLFADAGFIVIVALISPFEKSRRMAREIIQCDFYQIYIKASIEVCQKRDVKGFYKEALEGKILNYTGIGSQYESPISSDLIINSENETVDHATELIYSLLLNKGIL